MLTSGRPSGSFRLSAFPGVKLKFGICRFFVVNDGSPIDFSISHGSLAAGGSPTGRAEVRMEEVSAR